MAEMFGRAFFERPSQFACLFETPGATPHHDLSVVSSSRLVTCHTPEHKRTKQTPLCESCADACDHKRRTHSGQLSVSPQEPRKFPSHEIMAGCGIVKAELPLIAVMDNPGGHDGTHFRRDIVRVICLVQDAGDEKGLRLLPGLLPLTSRCHNDIVRCIAGCRVLRGYGRANCSTGQHFGEVYVLCRAGVQGTAVARTENGACLLQEEHQDCERKQVVDVR